MCKMFLSLSTDVYVIFCYWNILMKWTQLIFICDLLMLTYFLCGKYFTISILLLIIYWCWLIFMCKMFLSLSTDVYVIFCYWNISIFICHLLMLIYFLCGKYSRISILLFDYLLMLTIFLCAKCSYHSQLMFMWFSCTKTYWWSGCTSSSFVIYCFWLLSDVDYFSCENVFIIVDWCLCDFLLLKHIDEVDGLHPYLSLTYFLCVKCSTLSILLLIIY